MVWSGLLDKRQDKPTHAHPPLRLAVDSSPAGQLGWPIILEGAWPQLGGWPVDTSAVWDSFADGRDGICEWSQNLLHPPAARAQEMAESWRARGSPVKVWLVTHPPAVL